MASKYPKGGRSRNPHASPKRDPYQKAEAVSVSPLVTGLFAELVRDGIESGALEPDVAAQMVARFGDADAANDNGGKR